MHRLLDPGSYQLEVIDLADVASEIFDWKNTEVAALNEYSWALSGGMGLGDAMAVGRIAGRNAAAAR